MIMKLAILGFGVVGGGVYQLANEKNGLTTKAILERRPSPERGSLTVTDFAKILEDPEIEIVAEAMGGLHPAFEYVSAAMKAGKHVVTSNKALVAAYYNELITLAKEHGVAFRCTAAVGGGIPWLVNLERVARMDAIKEIRGICNGTTNYILDVMTRERRGFDEVLAEAQILGYAEKDPTADIDGWDIRRKLVISANIAFGVSIKEENVPMAGIRHIKAEDIAAFTKHGLTCKMIASAKRSEGRLCASVEPTLLKAGDPEASVPLNFNRISLVAEALGPASFFGQGAGRYPTAVNVVEDCIDIRNGCRSFYADKADPCEIDGSALRAYYVRAAKPADFADVKAGEMGAGILTKPMPVAEMHRRAGAEDFFAALPEEC